MTQNGKKTGKKSNRREKVKYPALNKGLNTLSRKDYIEPDYVDGVYDKDGKKVIRSLTEEETEWLNQFYEESIITNFYHDKELKHLNKMKKRIIEDETVQQLNVKLKELQKDKSKNSKKIKDFKEIIKLTKKQNEETYSDKLNEIEEELNDLRQEKLLYPDKEDHKQFYKDNNSRNSCIFNKSRAMNTLIGLDTDEYDAYLSRTLNGLDSQQILIYEIEREIYEDQEERLNDVIEEAKKEFKKKTKS